MTNKYFYHNSTFFVIKNKRKNTVKSFKNRKEFIKFLEENVELNEKSLIQFKKDINILTKEEILYKYLKDWYEIK